MAVHIETGTMASPWHYKSKNLDHLGLVAGMYDELGLGKLIDDIIVQDDVKRTVSIGQAVKAMVLNGLGACRTYEFRLQIRRNRPKSSPVFVKYTKYSPQTGDNLASILQIFASKS